MMVQFLTGLSWLYEVPLWLSGIAFLLLFLVAIEIGYRTGRRVFRMNRKAGYAVRGDTTITALLALLGLILAFTYSFALSRYDHRKEAVIEDVNAIGTAFLRADLLPEPGRTELRRRLLVYAQTRQLTAEDIKTRARLARTIDRTLKAQANLWPAMSAAIAEKNVDIPVKAAVISAINNLLDVHNKRLTAGIDHIPVPVLLLLVFVAAFSLAMTTHNAALQGSHSKWRMWVFAIVLAALIVVIMDFDMPLRGLIRANTAGMETLIRSMEGVYEK